jgi:hypothetical protein
MCAAGHDPPPSEPAFRRRNGGSRRSAPPRAQPAQELPCQPRPGHGSAARPFRPSPGPGHADKRPWASLAVRMSAAWAPPRPVAAMFMAVRRCLRPCRGTTSSAIGSLPAVVTLMVWRGMVVNQSPAAKCIPSLCCEPREGMPGEVSAAGSGIGSLCWSVNGSPTLGNRRSRRSRV